MPGFTKNAIKKEFLRLLDEKPLSQITVKNIVEACGINRNSFYYHYQDIPALIEEIVREQADIFIADYPDIGSMEEAINAVVDFCSRNRRAILHIYKSVNRDIFEDYLWKICDYVLSAYAKTAFKGHRVSESDRRLILDYYGLDDLTEEAMQRIREDYVKARRAWIAEIRKDAQKEFEMGDVEQEVYDDFISKLDHEVDYED